MPSKIALAYSGGLDTSAIIPWLVETYDCDVIAVVGDVGQGDAELEGIEDKAIRTGACDCHVVDLKRAFLEDYVFPTLLTGGVYEGRYLLGTSMARPILAKAQVEVALQCGADALSHGCTGKGNDQVRFESAFASLAPELEVIAPWRIWDLKGREDLLAYLAERNIPCSASAEKIYSRDANIWHISHEGGELEDPWNAPPADVWMLTTDPADAPDIAESVTISFEHGRPQAVDGVTLPPETLVAQLNTLAGKHGVGRIDIVENRLVGMKSRGCYETPGGTVIIEAMRALEEIVYDRAMLHYREQLGLTFADLVYDGQWFTPLREAMFTSVETMAERMTGDVVVRLYKGTATAVQRRSPNSLFDAEFATFESDAVYDHKHAEGFIRLHSLPARIAAMKNKVPVS